jgi:hypothetical protein
VSHLSDVETLRRQARDHIDDGPVTEASLILEVEEEHADDLVSLLQDLK